MSKTTADLISDTRSYLDEAQPADWTAAEVLDAINYGYQYVASKVMEVYEDYYYTTTPTQYNTVASTQDYTIASTFLKVTRVEINYNTSDANSQPMRAIAIKLDDYQLNKSNDSLGGSGLYSCAYYLFGNESAQRIGFIPIPTRNGTNAISVWGIQAPSDLSAAADSVVLPYVDNFAGIVSKLAAGRLLKKGQQEVKAGNDLINEAMGDILNMQTWISERQSDGPKLISEAAWDDVDVGDSITSF